MGKKIDKYIIFQFAKNFLFALLCFITIFILIDLFETLDKFIDNKVGYGMILEYYFYFTPEIIKLITPVSVLLATLFTAGRMVNFNEIVAVKNAGVSLIRFMAPLLFCGILVTLISLYFNNWIVPEANKKKFFIERNYLKKNIQVSGLGRLYFQESRNQFLLMENFRDDKLSASGVSIQIYNPDTLTRLIKRIDAKEMIWENEEWILIGAVERTFSDDSELMSYYERKKLNEISGINKISIRPEQITRRQLKPDEMNYTELKDFIDGMRKTGQNIDRQLVDYYAKISFPFSSIIVIIFAMAISAGTKRKKGLAMQFGMSILISFIYLGFTKISNSFGYNGDLDPLLTAWLANITFFSVGAVVLYKKNY
ncbi:MAG: LPS export ABC transporter permease LptG [Ignavibacteria bacterium]|nr:LPS export ABC transporter permease LptG [Ignavibacteria bacterium]